MAKENGNLDKIIMKVYGSLTNLKEKGKYTRKHPIMKVRSRMDINMEEE